MEASAAASKPLHTGQSRYPHGKRKVLPPFFWSSSSRICSSCLSGQLRVRYRERGRPMSRLTRCCASLAPIVVSLTSLAAQEHDHGRSAEQLGRVDFTVSCGADASERFERAMALLHSFWWQAAERAFRDVAAADSTCAMAYWGLALTHWRNPFAGG